MKKAGETATVLGIRPGVLKIGAVGLDEIFQNIKVIVTTRKGSVPLDRFFGLDMAFLDRPIPVAKVMAQAAVAEAIEKYEPRVKVEKIKWQETEFDAMIGRLAPAITVRMI